MSTEIIKNKKLLSSIADRYGTPLYVYDKQRIHDNVTTLSNALSKSFDNFHILNNNKTGSAPLITVPPTNNSPHVI